MKTTTKKGFDVPAGFPIPLNKSVIIEKIKEQTEVSKIILTEAAEENNVGRVMAVADNCDPRIKVGSKVMFNILENRTIRFEGNYYFIMHEIALFCVLPEKAILMPETISKRVKDREAKLVNEQKRLNENYKRELNSLDKVKSQAKKKFAKKK
jgi:co-chaperonin GroES (HSP10)